METSLIIEVHIFISSIYGGFIGGLIYDFYKSIRYLHKSKKILTYFGDLLFWLTVVLVSFAIIIRTNSGQIRGYIVLGFFLGTFMYFKIFSPLIFPACLKICKLLRNLIHKFFGIVFFPARLIKTKLSPSTKKLQSITRQMIRDMKKYRKIISSKK